MCIHNVSHLTDMVMGAASPPKFGSLVSWMDVDIANFRRLNAFIAVKALRDALEP